MPTLHGTMPDGQGPERRCIWCGNPTDITFVPSGMPDLGPQPMHLACGIGLLRAYQRWLDGLILPERDLARLQRLAGLRREIGAGH